MKIDPIAKKAADAAKAAFLAVAQDPNVSPRDKWIKRQAYMDLTRALYRNVLRR